jgi:hypothetical protein
MRAYKAVVRDNGNVSTSDLSRARARAFSHFNKFLIIDVAVGTRVPALFLPLANVYTNLSVDLAAGG